MTTHRLALASVLALFLMPLAWADDPPATWKVAAGDAFDLDWSYAFAEQLKGNAEGGSATRRESISVKAEVKATAAFAGEGALEVALREVTWEVEDGYKVRLTRRDGGAPEVEVLDEGPSAAEAAGRAAEMKERAGRRYRLLCRAGETHLQVEVDGRWAGGASAPSLFARCYVQSDLPEGTKAGAKWVDERDPEFLPIYAEPGRSEEYPQVTMRLVRGDSGVVAKGAGKSTFKGITTLNWSYKGKSQVRREFEYSDQGHLASSLEQASSKVSRVDNHVKGNRQEGSIEVEQSLSLKKRG